ncbi:MAG TPA: PKD domain-containing protein, partial [Vicinamibacteria bacterium]|nr:PKD domain-containing protein [Vicinamibacteria bacterium]
MILALALGFSIFATSQTLEDITHVPPPCMGTGQFPLLEVKASSPEAARARRLLVRFRAEDDAGWYELEVPPAVGTVYQVALPRPILEAVRVHYYFASGRPEVRTPEYVVNVMMGGCPGARAAATELTEQIRVRRTSDEQREFPIGFDAVGIRTGGISGTTLGIVAGAGAGAGIAALTLSGDDEPPDPTDPTNPTAIRACFTPDPIPDIDSGDTLVFDASCTTPATVGTYQWNFGDGVTAQGRSVEHLFRPGGLYTVSLTVTEGGRTDSTSRLVNVQATPIACFITNPDPPRIVVNASVDFNADCAVGDRDGGPTFITTYTWDFGDGTPGGEGRFVSHLFTAPDLYGVTLTVTNEDGRQDRITQFVVVERRSSSNPPGLEFVSQLELPAGVNAQIAVNDSETMSAIGPSPQRHRTRGRSG